jgi:hypothetical protein
MNNKNSKEKSVHNFLDIELQKEKTKQLEILRDIKRIELEMKKKEYESSKKNLFNILEDNYSNSSSDSSKSINNLSKSSDKHQIPRSMQRVSIDDIDITNISILSKHTYETIEEIEINSKNKKENRKGASTGNRTQIFSLED